MGRVTLNIGTWNGGSLVNMLPGRCTIEAIFVCLGVPRPTRSLRSRDDRRRYPPARMRVISSQEPHGPIPTSLGGDLSDGMHVS